MLIVRGHSQKARRGGKESELRREKKNRHIDKKEEELRGQQREMEIKENSYVLLLEIKIPKENYKWICVGITFSKMCMQSKIYPLLHELKKDPLD